VTTLHSDIPKTINNNANDSKLNDTIESYLTDNNINKTVDQWRIDNYAQLRKWAYPKPEELNDAEIKLNSGDTSLEDEGQNQKDDYIQKCLDVKSRFPKE